MKIKFEHSLAAAIVVAAILVSATLIYAGMQFGARPDEARVLELIDERLAREQERVVEEKSAAPVSPGGKTTGLSDKEFNARVEKGIFAFLEKQRRAEEERPNKLAANVAAPGTGDHVYGNPKAALTVIEYSDFECPFCKSVHATIKRVVDESNGQINWVYRHFPLENHNPGALKQAEASECAAQLGGNDAFWKYTDALYARTRSGGRGFPLDNLVPLAQEFGLDKAAFEQCVNSGKFARKVEQQMRDGVRAGISGTPGNILYHGKSGRAIALHGAQPYERFRAAADSMLGKK